MKATDLEGALSPCLTFRIQAILAGTHSSSWRTRFRQRSVATTSSAECGLKAVMRSLGMPAETPSQYRKHVQGLWPIFEDFAKDRDGGRYLDLLPDGKPFSDWSHHDRYAHRERFSRVTVEPRREAAQGIRRMMGFIAQDENP